MSEEKEKLKKFLEKIKLQNKINKLAEKYKDKKLIAYGSGQMAEIIVNNYDLSKLNILGFADSKYMNKKEDFYGYNTFSPSEISELNPDIILYFILEPKLVWEYFEFYYPELENIKKEHILKRNFFERIFGN